MSKNFIRGALFSILVLSAASASATFITAAPSGSATTTFAGGNTCTYGASSSTVSGFAVQANNNSCQNYDSGWGFASNGGWSLSLIGDNSGVTTIRIDLGGLYSSVGGFMNMAPGNGTPTISAIANDGVTVLDTYDLTNFAFPSGQDVGAFVGIDTGTTNIRYFDFGGSYLAMHDITLSSANNVPEPATLALLGLGLFGFAGARRRKQ